MNFDSIAKMVHEFVKNPSNMYAKENGLAESKVETKELSVIQTVFSKYEVSGDVITIGITPMGYWA
jgi:hypothetical protein